MAMTMAGAGRGGRFDLKQNSDINVTPFVDVMLVLLIVMMVTAPLATVAVKMDLPPAGLASAAQPAFISITDKGLYISAGGVARPTSLDALPAGIGRALGGPAPTSQQILVRADRHVNYGRFMRVVNALKAAGYNRIGLISEDLGATAP
jgi:biopolymer transport protein ExbD